MRQNEKPRSVCHTYRGKVELKGLRGNHRIQRELNPLIGCYGCQHVCSLDLEIFQQNLKAFVSCVVAVDCVIGLVGGNIILKSGVSPAVEGIYFFLVAGE